MARSLLDARLVDELRLVVAPTVAGRGRRLFGEGELSGLELVDVDRTPTGLLLLGYRVRNEQGRDRTIVRRRRCARDGTGVGDTGSPVETRELTVTRRRRTWHVGPLRVTVADRGVRALSVHLGSWAWRLRRGGKTHGSGGRRRSSAYRSTRSRRG